MKKRAAFFLLMFFCDFLLKRWVFTSIPIMGFQNALYPFGGIGVFENFMGINFAICHVQNLGCAWGLFSQYSEILFFSRIILIFAFLVYLSFFNKEKDKTFALLLITTGAIGNIFDFFIYGSVVDMFFFYSNVYAFPVFNLADSFICIGVGLLIIQSIISNRKKRQAVENAKKYSGKKA